MKRTWMMAAVLAFTLAPTFLAGCANRNNCNDIAMVREVLELAKHDQVEGNLKVHLNGDLEAGMRNGFYFGSPGTVVQTDLAFKIKDVESPTTKPAIQTNAEPQMNAERR